MTKQLTEARRKFAYDRFYKGEDIGEVLASVRREFGRDMSWKYADQVRCEAQLQAQKDEMRLKHVAKANGMTVSQYLAHRKSMEAAKVTAEAKAVEPLHPSIREALKTASESLASAFKSAGASGFVKLTFNGEVVAEYDVQQKTTGIFKVA